ncbi:hypothetical protein HYPSUDRAFT_200952 [Hypholoma sublateritium FD-334 SS-4]|uniref:DEAD/DEAH box helicase domain-containing protein n=1 Tax=Hypholoma sublateritium (strain FD-334 SS-4) TaxID=945553 RepID=A0A0D2PWE0_HYPSF|nr:hypothetical protein HYPSUDRAFT_207565 [Hypholoma sublateritium FD-334 SS-4]KJA23805.1 hypothetical protein HYPSUDRAFT_200952 [Hypholoma sublateritium FD-334 SS-4]
MQGSSQAPSPRSAPRRALAAVGSSEAWVFFFATPASSPALSLDSGIPIYTPDESPHASTDYDNLEDSDEFFHPLEPLLTVSTPKSASKPAVDAAGSSTFPPLLPGFVASLKELRGPSVTSTPIQSLSIAHCVPPRRRRRKAPRMEVVPPGVGVRVGQVDWDPRGLVLAPTHELVRQLAATAKSLLHEVKLRVVCTSRADGATPLANPSHARRRHRLRRAEMDGNMSMAPDRTMQVKKNAHPTAHAGPCSMRIARVPPGRPTPTTTTTTPPAARSPFPSRPLSPHLARDQPPASKIDAVDSPADSALEVRARGLSSRIRDTWDAQTTWADDLEELTRDVEGLFNDDDPHSGSRFGKPGVRARHQFEGSGASGVSASLPSSSSMHALSRSARRPSLLDLREPLSAEAVPRLHYSQQIRANLIAPPPRAMTQYMASTHEADSILLPSTMGVRSPPSRHASPDFRPLSECASSSTTSLLSSASMTSLLLPPKLTDRQLEPATPAYNMLASFVYRAPSSGSATPSSSFTHSFMAHRRGSSTASNSTERGNNRRRPRRTRQET